MNTGKPLLLCVTQVFLQITPRRIMQPNSDFHVDAPFTRTVYRIFQVNARGEWNGAKPLQSLTLSCFSRVFIGERGGFRKAILHIAALLPVQRITNAFQARPHLPNQLHSRVIIFLPRNPPQILLHAHSIERTLQLLLSSAADAR